MIIRQQAPNALSSLFVLIVALLATDSALAHAQITQRATSFPTYTWHYNHSSTFYRSVDIGRNGSGSAYAFACQAASASYENAEGVFFSTRTASTVPTYVSSYQTTTELWDVWTTDCQGIPHVRGTKPTAVKTVWSTTTYTNFAPNLATSYPGTSPSCQIEPSDCAIVQSSYSKETEALSSFTATLTPPFYVTGRPSLPSCTTVCTASEMCMIRGDEVRLIYWPVTTTGADSCHLHGTTVMTSGPAVTDDVVTLGTTFAPGSAYISFKSLWAWDWGCYSTIGKPISNTIIAINSKSLSSARGNHLGRSAVSFNLADLNGFVTSAAFCAQQPYDWYPCTTIYDDLYNPIIWMPQEVLSFRPEWKSCDLSIFGIVDPPIALHTAEYLTTEDPKPTKTPHTYPAPSASSKVTTPTPTAESQVQYTSKPSRSSQHAYKPTTTTAQTPYGTCSPASSGMAVGGYIASLFNWWSAAHTRPYGSCPSQDGGQPELSKTMGSDMTSTGGRSTTTSDGQGSGGSGSSAPEECASIAPKGVVYGTSTVPFASFVGNPSSYESAWYSVATDSGGHSFASVAGTKLYVTSSATVIGGHTVSAGTKGVVVDGSRTIDYGTQTAHTSGGESSPTTITSVTPGTAAPEGTTAGAAAANSKSAGSTQSTDDYTGGASGKDYSTCIIGILLGHLLVILAAT